MTQRTRRRGIAGWPILFAAAAAIAATWLAPSAGAAAPPAHKDVLRIAIAGYENNLTPFSSTGASGIKEQLSSLIYDTLFYSAYDFPPKPSLASRAQVSQDKRTWTIDIRHGVRWSDGEPLTAADVAFTYKYFAGEQNGRYSHHVNDLPTVTRYEVVDGDTVRFTCREACPTFDTDPGASMPILPEHVWKKVKEPATFTQQLPVGSGPYRVTRMEPDQLYVLRANPSYFGGRPLVDRLELPIVKDPSATFLALRNGELDAASATVPPEAVQSLRQSGTAVVKSPAYASVQVVFNNQRPPFDNPRFRSALNLGVQTKPIADTLYRGYAQPGVESVLPPDSPFAVPGLRDQYDPAKANELLDSLGFQTRAKGGVRETSSGKPLAFKILVASDQAQQIRAAQLVSGQLDTLGIKADVAPLDPVTLNARRSPPEAGKVDVPATKHTGDYDMYMASYPPHYIADPDGLLYAFHCPGETGFGAYTAGYCNKEFDRLIDRASHLGLRDRIPLLRKASQVMYRDPPQITLYFPDGVYAYDAKAYTGWIPEAGIGIINRRSFLPGPRKSATQIAGTGAGGGGGSGSAAPVAIVIVLVVAAVAGLMRLRRRRSAASETQGPEID